mmetsp:Transcript_51243/g.136785  ORF Transcript_51243/g.136785 Transcript_51243/m.136785 type:complete len:99 (-) Transcript_51243:96-392(-)|eukprot:CAMPEP_0194503774 /NCGR_PEP_ID=MMETSP0253-20130528/28569_1 /TAXON_ID=2966 /ORGANISM="Noctiluca scintillans" /LENGTH=98 /DNA_ID=CAMNT_0039346091 /DNA_START=70 /DNA_END=366 /DNA_ORIENTATION=-
MPAMYRVIVLSLAWAVSGDLNPQRTVWEDPGDPKPVRPQKRAMKPHILMQLSATTSSPEERALGLGKRSMYTEEVICAPNEDGSVDLTCTMNEEISLR